MNFRLVLPLMFVAGFAASAADHVEFTIIGRIKFSVPSNWQVIANKSSAEKTIFAFQIPNAADNGTPDSSNLSIISSYLKDANDRHAFKKKATTTEHNSQAKELVEGWRCRSFSSITKSTQYVVWDCYRIVEDCGVSVRIAWPHLPKNVPNYNEQMETVLASVVRHAD